MPIEYNIDDLNADNLEDINVATLEELIRTMTSFRKILKEKNMDPKTKEEYKTLVDSLSDTITIKLIQNLLNNIQDKKDNSPFNNESIFNDFLQLIMTHPKLIKQALEPTTAVELNLEPKDPPRIISEQKKLKEFGKFLFRINMSVDKRHLGECIADPLEQLKTEDNKTIITPLLSGYVEAYFKGTKEEDLVNNLRAFLKTFKLPGEAQKIERIIDSFAQEYFKTYPPENMNSSDPISTLCYSIIMLNTDAHNKKVKKKMTEEEFIKNNRGINNGKDFDKDVLSNIYKEIKNNEIKMTDDNTPSQQQKQKNSFIKWLKNIIKQIFKKPKVSHRDKTSKRQSYTPLSDERTTSVRTTRTNPDQPGPTRASPDKNNNKLNPS